MKRAIRQNVATAIAAMMSLTVAFSTAAPALAGPHLLVDIATGRVIEHEDAFQKWYPASLTKMMTAYVAFRQIKAGRIQLSTPIVMSKLSAGQPASKLYLKPGDALTLDDALKVLLVKSANDVAFAIAENIGGSMPAYVDMMNSEAARLGMASTHYVNPNGLPGPGQYTNARDLAVLVLAIKREFPEYAHYFALEGVRIGKHEYGNYNKLIARFDGADGMKTGYICASGFNQVSSASRDGRGVISVVLGSESLAARANLSANLLQKGLTEPTSMSMTSIYKLKPYGATRDQVNDVSDLMCKKKGKKVRSEAKDEVGGDKVASPFLHEINRPLNFADVTILAAAKPDKNGTADSDDVVSNIPIPAPRPVN